MFYTYSVDGQCDLPLGTCKSVKSKHHVLMVASCTALNTDGDVQMLFLVGGAQMIVAEVVVAALLGHYFTAAADWVVPSDVGLAILIIICIFVSGFAYR